MTTGNDPVSELFERQMLAKISELSGKIDLSLAQGQKNGEELIRLSTELGVGSIHGRIPRLEQDVKNFEQRLILLEERDRLERGRESIRSVIISALTSSGAVFLYEWIFRGRK